MWAIFLYIQRKLPVASFAKKPFKKKKEKNKITEKWSSAFSAVASQK